MFRVRDSHTNSRELLRGWSPPYLGEREGPVPSNAGGAKDPSHTQHIEGGRVGKTHMPTQAELSRASLTEYNRAMKKRSLAGHSPLGGSLGAC